MKTLLKNAREHKQLKTRELAQLIGIDQALISKFESGTRKPTKEQVIKLAALLDIDYETIMITWLKEKIIYEIGEENLALQALSQAQEEIKSLRNNSLHSVSKALQQLLDEVDVVKSKLDKFRQFESNKVTQTVDLEFTFESNRLEGNTLSLQETALVINQGVTIAGKTMKEHLEVINHLEALTYVRGLAEKKIPFTEKELLTIHHFLARGIQLDDAGKYRKTELDSETIFCLPTHPTELNNQMDHFFTWYESHKNSLHPILLAAETHLKLQLIQPFSTCNGKTSRLVQNLILLQQGYIIANAKGDIESKSIYQNNILKVQKTANKEDFLLFIARTEKECLERYIGLIAQ
jgi:Fic family protein